MSKLIAQSPLDNAVHEINGITITALNNHALVSIAIPKGANDKFSKNITKSYKTELPEVGQSTNSSVDNMHFLGLQSDQLFALFEYSGDRAVEYLSSKINDVAYLSDQSDSWVMLRISGNTSHSALERICPIDLHPSTFPPGSVARTSMEHLATIIICENENSYLLMSPRSSANSFLQAILTSIDNIS